MSEARSKRIVDWTVRLGVPLAVLVTVLAVFFGEQMGIDHEVTLLAPPATARGEMLPIRAIVVTDLEAVEGPRIVSLPVDVTLADEAGAPLVEARLEASVSGGADGAIRIPAHAPDVVVLRAVARLDGRGVATASRRYELEETPAPLPLEGRVAHGTQHFTLGPIQPVWEGPPPSVLEPRVVGGACVPEARCEILVNVGPPGARVTFAASPQADVIEASDEEGLGVRPIAVRVHGPEAGLTLEARRGEALLARRLVRLPVALATPSLEVEARTAAEPDPSIAVGVLGDRPGVIVDAYRDGRWLRTASVAPSDDPFAAPLGLTPGVWRLQVHTDPFSSARAASRLVHVGDGFEAALPALYERAEDPGATPIGTFEHRFAWAAANLEVGHHELPGAVRGIEQDRARLAARQRVLRVVALIAMGVGLVVLVVVFLRRGVNAALEAQRVMEATGDPELTSARHRRRTLLSALAIVGTVLLAFLAAGAMIVARARLLE